MRDGSCVQYDFIEFIPVRAFRLEPITPCGYLVVDGEIVEYGPIQAESMPSAGRVMFREP